MKLRVLTPSRQVEQKAIKPGAVPWATRPYTVYSLGTLSTPLVLFDRMLSYVPAGQQAGRRCSGMMLMCCTTCRPTWTTYSQQRQQQQTAQQRKGGVLRSACWCVLLTLSLATVE
jgi:hypothetical protein